MNRFWLTTVCLSLVSGYSFSQKKELTNFIPDGYTLYNYHTGDLNNDGEEDCVLIIKETNQHKIVLNRFEKEVDRNRRGIMVLFSKNNSYELVTKNYDCFKSENEDGGVYYPPQLAIVIEKGNLYIQYSHGRYGYWEYTFRYQNSDFELIGYDSTSGGVVIESEVSINFLTKKKLTRINTNENSEGSDEVFKDTWTQVKIDRLIKLSEIKDFHELEMYRY